MLVAAVCFSQALESTVRAPGRCRAAHHSPSCWQLARPADIPEADMDEARRVTARPLT